MRKNLLAILLTLAGLCFPQSARGQFIGEVGLQTVSNQLAINASCTGLPQVFIVQNLGQVAHQATANSGAPSFSMEIDGTDAAQVAYRISNPATTFAVGTGTAYVVQGFGYYPKITVSVTCTSGQIFSLSYSGSQTSFSNIIGPPGGTPTPPSGGLAAEVQGVVAQNASGGLINPVIEGGVNLALNGSFLSSGIDNFITGGVFVAAGTNTGVIVGTAPTPSKSGEIAIAFDGNQSDLGTTTVAAPWVVNANASSVTQFTVATLSGIGAGQIFQRNYTNSTPGGSEPIAFVLMAPGSTAIRQTNSNSGATISFTGATLAGSTVLIGVECTANTTACAVSGVTDTQGNTYKLVEAITFPGTSNIPGIWVFATTNPTTAAADTITPAFSTGSGRANAILELSTPATAALTQLSTTVQVDPTGRQVVGLDAQAPNQFNCNVTISTATTTQCQGAPTTINGVAVRAYVTDVQYNTTTAGAGSLLQLVTGTAANCGTGTANLSAITYSGAAVALQNTLGMRTPLVAPLQSAVCVKQTGATPSTSVVEVHGYFAP